MPAKLTTTINKISSVPNPTNSTIIEEFSRYMKENGSSEHHQNHNLKAIIAFASFLGLHTTFYGIQKNEQIMAFLNTKINREDNENRWITTWNNYLTRLKLFFDGYTMREEKLPRCSATVRLGNTWYSPGLKKRKPKGLAHTQRRNYGEGVTEFLFILK